MMIDFPIGPIPVEQLETGDLVTGYDGTAVVVRQIHQYQENAAETRHLKVVFEGREEIELSSRNRIGGVPAGELNSDDVLEGWRVAEVQLLGGVLRRGDLLTDDVGYRVQGIPVNCMIHEVAARLAEICWAVAGSYCGG